MSMAEVCCDSAVARARAGRRRRAAGGAGRWRLAAVEKEDEASLAAVSRKRRVSGAGDAKRHGTASVVGRRREMEDAVSVRESFVVVPSPEKMAVYDFYGVFDGHGCSHVADACRHRMHELVAEEMHGAGDVAGAMERGFARMDAEVRDDSDSCCRCQGNKCDHVGSTAVVAVVGEKSVVVANCGDSRAILCRNGAPIPLSSDHKPDRPDELERIEQAGGRVIFWEGARVLGVLAMSRAIGDGYLKPFVSAVPEVTVTDRNDAADECLILASDGLWNVVTNETACEVAQSCLRRGRERWCAETAAILTKLALMRQSSDNISVVVVDLRPRNPV